MHEQGDDGRGRAVPVDGRLRCRASEQRGTERRRQQRQGGRGGQGIPRRGGRTGDRGRPEEQQRGGSRRSGTADRRVLRRRRRNGRARCADHRRAGARVPVVVRRPRHGLGQRHVRGQIAAAEDLAGTAGWPRAVAVIPQESGHHTGAAHVAGRHRLQRLQQ